MTLLSLTYVTGHMGEGWLGGGSSWTLQDSDLLDLRVAPGQGETLAMAASTLAHTVMVITIGSSNSNCISPKSSEDRRVGTSVGRGERGAASSAPRSHQSERQSPSPSGLLDLCGEESRA